MGWGGNDGREGGGRKEVGGEKVKSQGLPLGATVDLPC